MAGGRSASPIPFHKSLHTGASIKKPAGFNTRRASQILWAHLSHPNISTLAITFRNLIYHFCQLDLSLFRSASAIKHIHRVSMQRDDEQYTPLSLAHASHELIAFGLDAFLLKIAFPPPHTSRSPASGMPALDTRPSNR